MRPTQVSPLQKALEIVEALPPEDQELSSMSSGYA